MGLDKDEKPRLGSTDDTIDVGDVINASGHKQELDRQFSLLSICSIGITTGNVWAALGGSIVSFAFSPCQSRSTRRDYDTDKTRSSHSTMVDHQVLYMPSSLYRVSTL